MLHYFHNDISHIEPPKQFTWPFHYSPHALCQEAAREVMEHVATRHDWHDELRQGKMFGVLVVRDKEHRLGFLAAFSGNIAGKNTHPYFTPPVYDMLQPDDFFRREEAEISDINRKIIELECADELIAAHAELKRCEEEASQELLHLKNYFAQRKAERDILRRNNMANNADLIRQSQHDNAEFHRLKIELKRHIEQARNTVEGLQNEINRLKSERHQRSAKLQQQIFGKFRLLNALGQERDLCDIFASTPQHTPPAGAGECAAPKLLQYAYLNSLHPIAMAEFWWGNSPRGEIRRHGEFYPSCNSKCKPILMHMMQGLDVEENPLLHIAPPEPEIIWEDDHIVAINKPSGMLSVVGKSGVRSAEEWTREHYPTASGPMIVHRLDQSTSGVLIIAKDKVTHELLQQQFIHRNIKKSYVALLDGIVKPDKGQIDLPIKLDYENRPRQMVAPDGKRAITDFQVISRKDGYTRIRFIPITGRTHQLRVHAAHPNGLGTPIVGDDIYGRGLSDKAHHRLHLHAESIEFTHPHNGKLIRIECKADF
ncbi:MAG: RNA pseudouridine synthase [Alistipes sp.]|nr:RNA pseudouridine synthase [Alistipes sp.]